jgi:hypothetical protein
MDPKTGTIRMMIIQSTFVGPATPLLTMSISARIGSNKASKPIISSKSSGHEVNVSIISCFNGGVFYTNKLKKVIVYWHS